MRTAQGQEGRQRGDVCGDPRGNVSQEDTRGQDGDARPQEQVGGSLGGSHLHTGCRLTGQHLNQVL